MSRLPRLHPAPWQRVLLDEFVKGKCCTLEVIAVRKHFEKTFSFQRGNVAFHCLKTPGALRRASLFWVDTLLIKRHLKTVRPDLVHAWGIEEGAALIAPRLPFPFLVTMHGLLEWCSQVTELNVYQRFDVRLERQALRRASVVTAESRFAVDWLHGRYPHLEVHQVEHVPARFFHQVARRPGLHPPEFLFVGLVSHLKGTDLLFRALDKLKAEMDFRLTVVGPALPSFLRRIKEQSSSELLQRIRLEQDLTSAQIAEKLARATMVLFPTRADNSPNSVKEAVVAGVPVVASAIGGIVDYVVPGKNGLLFPPGNLDAFVEAIRAALRHPLFSKGTVEAATLADKRSYLSPEEMRVRFLAAYKRVLERART